MHVTIPKPLFVTLLILLNMVPIYGVFAWGWKSFDLIYLYWLENLIIGFFAAARFLLRRYVHPLELIFPLFMIPFFTFHYGMFCYGHGTILLSLFGEGVVDKFTSENVFFLILPIVESQNLFWPVVALFMYQVLDWVRDTTERGFAADNIKDLMVAPYKRIMILHFTILAGGFALTMLNEPLAGLLILIGLKTWFDFYHWNQDEQEAQKTSVVSATGEELDERVKQQLNDMADNLKITVNGKDVYFDSYEDLKASKHYKMLRTITNLFGGNSQLKLIDAYIEKRLAEKQK